VVDVDEYETHDSRVPTAFNYSSPDFSLLLLEVLNKKIEFPISPVE